MTSETRRAHDLLCTNDSAALTHGVGSGCHTLDISGSDSGATSDWDPGFYKGECATNEFVAGIDQSPNGQSPSGVINHILCCPGTVTKRNCATVSMFDGDTFESGAVAATGDWDNGFKKGECSPGRYVAGVSRTPRAADPAIAGAGHAIYCCTQ